MSIKDVIVGGVITLTIGGTAYTVNEADVIKNFAADTGMTQQEAESYAAGVGEEDLVSYEELGSDYISDGQEAITMANQIDCVNYEYDWQSSGLTCEEGKAQLIKVGNDEIELGNSFKTLALDSASKSDIRATIALLDTVNADYDMQILTQLLGAGDIDEVKKSNSYNKALLITALESNQ